MSKLSKDQRQILEAAKTFKNEAGEPVSFTALELAGKYNQMFDDNQSANSIENRLDKLVRIGMVNAPSFTLTAAGAEDSDA